MFLTRFGERSLLLAGSVVGFLGFFVALPWGSEMPPTVAPLPGSVGTNATEAANGWVPRFRLATGGELLLMTCLTRCKLGDYQS